jgi:hypothetical protein
MSVAYPEAGTFRIRRRGEDWITIPSDVAITVQQVASFPAKVTIGETTKGAHPLLSTWAFDGLTGGSGIVKHDGTTTHRYREGRVDARNAHFFGSPRLTERYTQTGAFMPHNDLVVSSVRRLYGSFGTDLYIWDEATDTWADTTKNLAAVAVNPGVAFKGTGTLKLFIPCGATGYATWDGTNLTNVTASGSKPAARDFAQLGTLFVCLDVGSQLWWSVDGTNWTPYGSSGTLDAGIEGRRLAVYKNGYGEKTLHISANCGLFTFDPAGPTLYDTDLALPPHPQQGTALARWRDQLYISAGMGVYSWNGSAVNMMGLDRNQGLSVHFRGEIVEMVGELNGLYALVDAAMNGFAPSLQVWTGEGWHCLWEGGEEAFTSVGGLIVSSAQGGYRLWWGTESVSDGVAFSLPVSVDGANAEELIPTGAKFTREWRLWTGETAMEMDGFTKIAVALSWEEYCADDVTLFAAYTIDSGTGVNIESDGVGSSTDAAWHARHYDFGYDATTGAYLGTEFERIELTFGGAGSDGDAYTGPELVRNVVLTFQKVPTGYRAWTARIDLKQLHDQGQEDFAALIDELVLAKAYCLFQYQQEEIRVKFGSWGGADQTGQAHHGGVRTVSIVEIPTTP